MACRYLQAFLNINMPDSVWHIIKFSQLHYQITIDVKIKNKIKVILNFHG